MEVMTSNSSPVLSPLLPSSPLTDFVVSCSSESFHLFHSLNPKNRLQFHCYELLLLRHLESDPALLSDLCDTFGVCDECSDDNDAGGRKKARSKRRVDFLSKHRARIVSDDLWFLHVTLQQGKDKLVLFLRKEVERRRKEEEEVVKKNKISDSTEFLIEQLLVDAHIKSDIIRERLLSRYLRSFNFSELHLDNITSGRNDESPLLPPELFKYCSNVTSLSLRSNYIRKLPPDIGRLKKLRRLCLTNNSLQNGSIPYTLTFCDELCELYLDNNLLDALPGFLLDMPSLMTVHRHGNHNYFKATFMWYHTDVNERIMEAPGLVLDEERRHEAADAPRACDSLQYMTMKAVVVSRKDFYFNSGLPPSLKERLSDVFEGLNLCGNCPAAKRATDPGYKVYTFKNPYLGNTCVPFLHWSCSLDCAREIEVPARMEQLQSAEEQDRIYRHYVKEAMNRQNNDGTGVAGSNKRSGVSVASVPSPACLLGRRSLNASCESIQFTRSSEGGQQPQRGHQSPQQSSHGAGYASCSIL
jgi:hypothetical protein